MNTAKKKSQYNGKSFLKGRFIDVENNFVQDLKTHQRTITHDPTLGDATEKEWIKLLEEYLPKRYRVAKAFAVDSKGETTDQLDCLIYDAHFTPTLFGKDNHQYVPAEAVYAMFEIKQTIDSADLDYTAKKILSLRKLYRTSAPLTGCGGESGPKPILPIIGGLLGINASWKEGLGKTFLKKFNGLSGDKKLDFVLTAESGFCDHFNTKNNPIIVNGEGSLVRGLFRLLKALRNKATVPAIDWDEYESVFDEQS